jgi:AI-2E family transporter
MVQFRRGFYASLGVLATAAAAVAVYTARAVLIWALIALFLAVSLDPAVRALTRWHIRRGIAIAVAVLVVLGMVVAFLQSVIPAMADQFHAMVKDFPHYLASEQHRSRRAGPPPRRARSGCASRPGHTQMECRAQPPLRPRPPATRRQRPSQRVCAGRHGLPGQRVQVLARGEDDGLDLLIPAPARQALRARPCRHPNPGLTNSTGRRGGSAGCQP